MIFCPKSRKVRELTEKSKKCNFLRKVLLFEFLLEKWKSAKTDRKVKKFYFLRKVKLFDFLTKFQHSLAARNHGRWRA